VVLGKYLEGPGKSNNPFVIEPSFGTIEIRYVLFTTFVLVLAVNK
jgi:hypothetical protein